MVFRRLKKPTAEQEREFQELMSDEQVTWKDRLAMVLSAYLTILLPCVLTLLAFAFLILWIFGAF